MYQYRDHLGNIRLSYTNDSSNPGAPTIIEENNYYPFGLEHKGYNNVVNGTEYNYKTFQGQELEEDLGKNTLAYQWRDYDPAIGRFNKIDRFAEKYEKFSPYHFSANNPVYFREIAGDSLNLSHLFVKNDKGKYVNQKAVEAFQYFAGTKEGKSYLSQFASKGQSIEGTDITFGSDGKYHNEGIDLAYNTKSLSTSDGRDGETGASQEKNGRFTIDVTLGASGSQYSIVGDITHETFIHVEGFTKDILDNKTLDYSYMSNFVNDRYSKRSRHHVQVKFDQRNKGNTLFGTKGFELLLNANKKYNENKTRNQVWSTMWDYVD